MADRPSMSAKDQDAPRTTTATADDGIEIECPTCGALCNALGDGQYEAIVDDDKMPATAVDVDPDGPGPWLFRADVKAGSLIYKSSTEEWTFNGSVEGRMSRPLAEVMANALRALVDRECDDE